MSARAIAIHGYKMSGERRANLEIKSECPALGTVYPFSVVDFEEIVASIVFCCQHFKIMLLSLSQVNIKKSHHCTSHENKKGIRILNGGFTKKRRHLKDPSIIINNKCQRLRRHHREQSGFAKPNIPPGPP